MPHSSALLAFLAPTIASAFVLPARPATVRVPSVRMSTEEQPVGLAGIHVEPAVEAIHQMTLAEHAQQLMLKNIAQRPMLKKAYRKLFTREDRFSAHKMLGSFCVLHAAFRLSQVGHADMGFGPTLPTLACILVHATLSLSSFLFRIPVQRRGGDLSCA